MHGLHTTRRAEAEPGDAVWRSRRFAAAAVRLVALGGPLACGTVAARVVVDMSGPDGSRWLVTLFALLAAIVVSLVTARLGMRLLPLAVLLKMTMLFPDRAPSRIKVARRATSKDELKRRLADPDADARETAATLLALVTALGRHDRKTRGHSERVRLYCDLIGAELGLNAADRGRLRWAGLLHDIGKLEVAASVLNKPSKLDDNEWRMVRTHPDSGARLAQPLANWLGPWFTGIAHHHERYDGAGYPNGLAGDQISLAGRAVAVVDAFETMTAARSYKSPMTTVAARAELTRCAGSHFDPTMVRAFLAIALPRLLWTMGPLTFLINAPFLRWIPVASERAATVATASMGAASNAVGVTAVSVALAAGQSPAMMHTLHSHTHQTLASSSHRLTARTPNPAGSSHAAPPPSVRSGPSATASATPSAIGTQHVIQAAAVGTPAGTPTGSPTSSSQPATSDLLAAPPDPATPPGRSDNPVTAPSSTDPTGSVDKPSDPPGQADPTTVPPGQAKKPTTPPGQSTTPTVPHGPVDKPSDPPGQAKKPTTPPGQAKKSGDPTPLGQANKPTTPPGQAKKSGDPTPPQQTSTPPDPPGQTSTPPDPPGQTSAPSGPPGQSGRSHGHGPGK